MRISTMFRSLTVIAVLAVLAAGCAGEPAPRGEGGDRFPVSVAGETYLEGQLELKSVVSPAEGGGKATFVVENKGGMDLEDVTVSIRFYMPPTGGGRQEWDVEVQDQNVNFFAGSRVSVSAVPTQPALVKGWQLRIESLTTVGDPVTGTEYLEGDLRCVEMVKDLTGARRSVGYTLKNVSDSPIEAPQYRVEFRLRNGKVVGATEWQSVGKAIPPGGSVILTPDLSGVKGELGGTSAVLKIQGFVL